MPQISDRELARLKQSLEELSTLNQIASAINVTMSLDEITGIIVDQCLRRLDAQQGATFLLETEEKQTDRFKTFVRQVSLDDVPFHLSQSLQGWMIRNKSILISNDPDNDERLRGVNFAKIGLKTLIAAPLLSRKGLIGVLVLFNKKADGGFDERDKRFLGIVGTQVAKVIENAQLFEKERELLEMQKEMDIARDIQQRFLPKNNISTERIDVYGFNDAATKVGGDYYDFVELSHHKIFFTLGDVAGHGIPAALLTGNALAVLRSQLQQSTEPDIVTLADRLNNSIYASTDADRYITGIIGIVDTQSGVVTYINAGHLPPLVIRKSGQLEKPDEADVVFGVVPGLAFTPLTIHLQSGDLLVFNTDGVTEAPNQHGELFGETRYEELLINHRGDSPDIIRDALKKTLALHCGKSVQADDITLLMIRLKE